MEYIIVQAGGKGTRLGHLTRNKPKALVPVENLPMLFHLFRKYPDKRFVIIADYKKEVLREYLSCFANVKYQVVDAQGSGTCAGVAQAAGLIPPGEAFMLIWSDLILPESFTLPSEYMSGEPGHPYVGISATFPCRWSYAGGRFREEASTDHGVAGFFLFTDKSQVEDVPQSGEFVRWLQQNNRKFREISLAGTKEFGLLSEYDKLGQERCRPFNSISVENGVFIKKAVDEQGRRLAVRECAWYRHASQLQISAIPEIYGTDPLKMEFIRGQNIYECSLSRDEKLDILQKLVDALKSIHNYEKVNADSFSMHEAYYNKTMARISRLWDLIPFAHDEYITVNGRRCRNVFYYKRDLEKRLGEMNCQTFRFIHGDCTFSNLMLRENGEPVLVDPRGYFGFTELFGDERYDWAKLYYSIVGNYDRFNLKDFRLTFGEDGVEVNVGSNHWEDMESAFFDLTGTDPYEIKLLHAVIWLSLTTYAWQDYDSICGAFYNGLYYLEEVL